MNFSDSEISWTCDSDLLELDSFVPGQPKRVFLPNFGVIQPSCSDSTIHSPQSTSWSEIQPVHYTPTEPSHLRSAIMNRNDELELAKKKRTASSGRKRKSSDAQIQDDSIAKRLRTVKPNIADERKSDSPEKTNSLTLLSTKTLSKLQAFRFGELSGQQETSELETEFATEQDSNTCTEVRSQDDLAPASRYTIKDRSAALIEAVPDEEPKASLYKIKDNSAALIRLGAAPEPSAKLATVGKRGEGVTDEESNMAHSPSLCRLKYNTAALILAGADAQPSMSPYMTRDLSNDFIECDSEKERPYKCYTIKDRSAALIEIGAEIRHREEECNPVDGSPSESQSSPEFNADDGIDWDYITSDLAVEEGGKEAPSEEFQGDQRQRSTKDDPPCDDSEKSNAARLLIWDDLDDTDETVFAQLIAEDKDNWEPTSAQMEINCFSSDLVSTPTKPSLMPPPPLILPITPSMPIAQSENVLVTTTPGAPFSPFFRPAPAKTVALPTQIPNLIPASRIPTCFRMAELLRQLNSISPPPTLELFATVTSSSRSFNCTTQSFNFADVFFPQRPPYIQGTYPRCTESELFDDDSRPFLNAGHHGQGILARAMVRAKPKENVKRQVVFTPLKGFHAAPNTDPTPAVELEVLSVWVCQWSDVDYTKGIVMSVEEEKIKTEAERLQPKTYVQEKKRRFKPLEPVNGNVLKESISGDWKRTAGAEEDGMEMDV